MRFQSFGAFQIRIQSRCMLTAVNFYYDAVGMTREVNNVAINSNLAAKMRARGREAMA
jgi:hypothetical protein